MQLWWELTRTDSRKIISFSESVFCKKLELWQGRAQKRAHGRRSEGNKAVSKV